MSRYLQMVCIGVPLVAHLVSGLGASSPHIFSRQAAQDDFSISVFKIAGMPALLDEARVSSTTTRSKLIYTVTNLAEEQFSEINFVIFGYDQEHRLKWVERYLDRTALAARSTRYDWGYLEREIALTDKLVVAVQKAVGRDGVWEVPLPKLKVAVEGRLQNQAENNLAVKYTPHAHVNYEEQAEILKLTLQRVLNDEEMRRYLMIKDDKVLLSAENISPAEAIQFNGRSIITITPQELSNTEGRLTYLNFGPVSSQGSTASAPIACRDIVKKGEVFLPCRGSYVFTYKKKSGRWTIKKVTR